MKSRMLFCRPVSMSRTFPRITSLASSNEHLALHERCQGEISFFDLLAPAAEIGQAQIKAFHIFDFILPIVSQFDRGDCFLIKASNFFEEGVALLLNAQQLGAEQRLAQSVGCCTP